MTHEELSMVKTVAPHIAAVIERFPGVERPAELPSARRMGLTKISIPAAVVILLFTAWMLLR